jgi:hypothetical protein
LCGKSAQARTFVVRSSRRAEARNPRAELTCIECGRLWRENERGWTARLTVDEDEPAEAVAYCPECAKREFGDRDST